MTNSTKAPNKLINETSPYLLQHAYNPVSWWPWCDEAFVKAKAEDKPVFLSIGYSTCHWCHVMGHESFEDIEIAGILNRYFVPIKVDKEERPDIDSIYMAVCQALTQSGGWPLTIIMTPEQKPFYAGTYFPKRQRFGHAGLLNILEAIIDKWQNNRKEITGSAAKITSILQKQAKADIDTPEAPEQLITSAVKTFINQFDAGFGGFGRPPKFPAPHNLMFLLKYYEVNKDKHILYIVEKTLTQMYKGGIFDHIGFGFARYATDQKWLVPHFEKMLYDNALLIMAYCHAYEITKNGLYKKIIEKTISYVLRELTDAAGAFYSAQDADSEGVEGKYYVFTPDEIISILGADNGAKFNRYFDITKQGNFEGKSIPNLLHNDKIDNSMDRFLPAVYAYRKDRTSLHKDDKVLTAWNGVMIAALVYAYKVLNNKAYLTAAKQAIKFIDNSLSEQDKLFASYRNGRHSTNGFLDDYSYYIFALLQMYNTTLENSFLNRAEILTDKTVSDFFDQENGGFYIYGNDGEQLILKPKESYDGAIPSGNSVMVYNLFLLSRISKKAKYEEILQKQITFMSSQVKNYPHGYSFFNLAMLLIAYPPKEIVCVLADKEDLTHIKPKLPPEAIVTVLGQETAEYKLINALTTFYICENNTCLPPSNEIQSL